MSGHQTFKLSEFLTEHVADLRNVQCKSLTVSRRESKSTELKTILKLKFGAFHRDAPPQSADETAKVHGKYLSESAGEMLFMSLDKLEISIKLITSSLEFF